MWICRRRLGGAAIGIGVAIVVLAAYGGVLDNFFHEVDDATHLFGAQRGRYPSPHFRPLHLALNVALLRTFGTAPLGWYAVGLAIHALAACFAAALVGGAAESRRAGAAAGLAFAAFYSPHEAVLWIGASCVLLAVVFILASALAWLRYLRTSGRGAYVLALAFMALAMGSKEDCVLLAPLLVGLDVALHGWRTLLGRRALARYLPFALLAGVYLAVAFRPAHWAEMPSVGEYSLRAALVPKLCANFAALFWPRDIDTLPWLAAVPGALIIAALAQAARRAGSMGRWIALGALLALCGLLPVLPGPDDLPIAGSRYAYASAIGAAFLAGGLFEAAWRLLAGMRWRTAARAALALAFATWIGVQVLALRSVEAWRYAERCARLERILATTRAAVLDPRASGTAAVVAPNLWNPTDYVCALYVFAGVKPRDVRLEHAPLDARLLERLRAGGDLDPASQAVFVSLGDASIVPFAGADGLPREHWEAMARLQAERGLGRTVPIVWIDRRPAAEASRR